MRPRARTLLLMGLLAIVTPLALPSVPGTTSCPQSAASNGSLFGLVAPVMACPGPASPNSPLAAFTYDQWCTACAIPGFPTLFNATWSSGTIVFYSWNFGDGTQANVTTPTVQHVYMTLGPNNVGFQVKLTVQDSTGLTDAITQTITPQAIPRFSFQPKSPTLGQPVTFDGSASQVYMNFNTTVAYSWSFGDGTGASGAVVNHAYSASGVYRVVLTFFNAYGKGEVSKTINDPPPAGGDGGGAGGGAHPHML